MNEDYRNYWLMMLLLYIIIVILASLQSENNLLCETLLPVLFKQCMLLWEMLLIVFLF